jgi:hypothetical protein
MRVAAPQQQDPVREPIVLACATTAELRAARRARARSVLVGIAARKGLPGGGPLVSFGLAGGLAPDVACGDAVDATRVVDATGAVLWEGAPLGVPGARTGTILAVDAILDDPAERRRLHEATGALAADMESGALARAGLLAGCLRVVSDTPERPLAALADAVTPDGRTSVAGLVRAFAASPRATVRAASDGTRALRVLAAKAEALG